MERQVTAQVARIGVVGAGTMGSGIAQLACLGGYEAVLQDPIPEALEAGAARMVESLAKGVRRELWSAEEARRRAGGWRPSRTSPASRAATW